MRFLLACTLWFRNGGFWKPPSPHLATVECLPGKTTLRLTRNGTVVGIVVLNQVTQDIRDGTSVEFVDLTQFMEARRVR